MGFADKSNKQKAAEKAAAEKAAAQAAKDAKTWEDNDKDVLRKKERKDAESAKQQEKLARQAELRALKAADEEEMSAYKSKQSGKKPQKKVTQAQIAQRQALLAAAKQTAKKKSRTEDQFKRVPENLNRQRSAPAHDPNEEDPNVLVASTVDEALAALGSVTLNSAEQKKMTFKEFEKLNLASFKADNPDLKHSQLQEYVWKQWKRAPENPENQQ